jgi:hypothetical protein
VAVLDAWCAGGIVMDDTRRADERFKWLPSYLPQVQGRCPACGATSLFLASGNHITCAIIGCPNPCAAGELLGDG